MKINYIYFYMKLFSRKLKNIFVLNEIMLSSPPNHNLITLKDYIADITGGDEFEIDAFDYKIINPSGKTIFDSEENNFEIDNDELTAYSHLKQKTISLNVMGTKNIENSSFDYIDSKNNTHQITFWN